MKRTTEKIFAAGLGLVMVLAQCGCKAGPSAEPSRSFGPDEVHTDIPDLCSVVASKDGLGEDAIMGTCYSNDETSDAKLMQLVTKHFNAVTLENELKPDCMFGYNNAAPASGSIHKEEHHIGWIFELKRGTLRIIPEKISCDAWRFFCGDVDAINEYQGEYMNTYSWANMREAYLDRMSENRK